MKFNEEQSELKRFILIIFGMVILLLIFYFVVSYFDKKDNKQVESFQTSEILVGNVFNQNDETYYVFIANMKEDTSYFSNNLAKIDKKVYYVDSSNPFNKVLNSNENKISTKEIKLKEDALIEIKNKEVVHTYFGKTNIENFVKNK